jgi:hypothetical protein
MSKAELEQHLRDNLALSSRPRGEDWATSILDDVNKLRAEKEKNNQHKGALIRMSVGPRVQQVPPLCDSDE